MAKKPAKRRKREGRPPPKCKAILLCDTAIVEAGTGKVSVIGSFDKFTLPQLPGKIPGFTIFVQLYDGVGRYDVVFEIHDMRKDKILAKTIAIGVEYPERLLRLNFILPLPPIPVAHSGNYDLVIFANAQEIDRQSFAVLSQEELDNANATE